MPDVNNPAPNHPSVEQLKEFESGGSAPDIGDIETHLLDCAACCEALALAPDERHLATGAEDGTVRWWDMNTGAELQRFEAHPGGALGVAVSPDGKELLSCGKDGTVRLWRLPTSLAPEKVKALPEP
jgi:WD40 repeat protein